MAGKLMATDMSPTGLLHTLSKWDQLSRKDQTFLERETKFLGEALADYGRSKLAIGRHLTSIQEKLQPLRMFETYLKAFHFKKSTAYSHITAFRNAEAHLPAPVLERAMVRNMSIVGLSEDEPLGAYTVPFKRLPPPNTDDVQKIDQYLDSIEEHRVRIDGRSKARKEAKGVERDSNLLTKMCFKFIKRCLSQLPSTGENRKDKARQISFVEDVMGMTLASLGVSSAKTIEPQAIPEEFRVGPGRPRKEENAA